MTIWIVTGVAPPWCMTFFCVALPPGKGNSSCPCMAFLFLFPIYPVIVVDFICLCRVLLVILIVNGGGDGEVEFCRQQFLRLFGPGTPHAKPPKLVHHPSHNTQIINHHAANDTTFIKIIQQECAYKTSRKTGMVLLRNLIFVCDASK